MGYWEIIGILFLISVLLAGILEKNWKPLLGLIGAIIFLVLFFLFVDWLSPKPGETTPESDPSCIEMQGQTRLGC